MLKRNLLFSTPLNLCAAKLFFKFGNENFVMQYPSY